MSNTVDNKHEIPEGVVSGILDDDCLPADALSADIFVNDGDGGPPVPLTRETQHFHVFDHLAATRLLSRVGQFTGTDNVGFLRVNNDNHSLEWESELKETWCKTAPLFSKKRKNVDSPFLLEKMLGATDIIAVMLQLTRTDLMVVPTARQEPWRSIERVPDIWGQPGGSIKKSYNALVGYLRITNLPTFDALLVYVRCLRRCCWVAGCLGFSSITVEEQLTGIRSCAEADTWFRTWSKKIATSTSKNWVRSTSENWEGSPVVDPPTVTLGPQTVSLMKSIVMHLLPNSLNGIRKALIVSRQLQNMHASHAICGEEGILWRYQLINALGGGDTQEGEEEDGACVVVHQWIEFVRLMEPKLFFRGLSAPPQKSLDTKMVMSKVIKLERKKGAKKRLGRKTNDLGKWRTEVEEVDFQEGLSPLRNLSKEELDRVCCYLKNDEDTEEIVSTSPFTYNNSIMKLRPGRWLNDEAVNNYMMLLARRDKILCTGASGRSRSHFFPSTFYRQFVVDQ